MKEVTCKTIITKSKLPTVDYSCNLYIGCTHSCTYCYAEFMKRFTGHISKKWGTFVDYKINAVEVLRKEIKKIERDKWLFLGSVTDTYQPVEEKLNLTRECLKIFLEHQQSISILTKSDLVTRDIDLFSKFDNIEVGMSISYIDERFSKLKLGATKISGRIQALKELKNANIKTYAFIGPIIPQITNLEEIFSLIGQDVDFVMGETLNLKFASLNEFKILLIGFCGSREAANIIKLCKSEKYSNEIKSEFESLCDKYSIENRGFFVHV